MRKTITLMILCIVLTSVYLLSVPVFASEETVFDSTYIDSEVYESVDLDHETLVFRVFKGCFFADFAQKRPVEEVLKNHNRQFIYYMCENNGNNTDAATLNGVSFIRFFQDEYEYTQVYHYDYSVNILPVLKNPQSIFSHFSDDVEILEMYYLDGEDAHEGVFVYFVTNQGNYVYYKQSARWEDEYLLPYEDFCVYAQAELSSSTGDEMAEGGGVTTITLANYVVERQEKPTFNHLYWIVPVGILFMSGIGITGWVIVKKRKKANP